MRNSFKIKPHRYIQLFGLYGVLFLIPVIQQEISHYSSQEDSAKKDKIYYATEQIYYEVQRLVCLGYGQQATTQDCKKGIYQNLTISHAADIENKAEKNGSGAESKYWILYYIFAALGFIGTYIEYRNEYENEKKSP